MTQPRKLYRQGDVLLVQEHAPIPTMAVKKDNIIAKGETTGHCHQFLDTVSVTVMLAADQQQIVHVSGSQPAALVHDDHHDIHVQPGTYQVRMQREYTLLEDIRQVVD